MRLFAGLALGFLAASTGFGQYIISAHSGTVQYVQGTAYLNDKAVETNFGQLPEIKENQVFRTEEGLAEILLTPGVFLRMPENSSIRMVSDRLTDTRVEVLTGSALVECNDIPKDNSIMLLYKGDTVMLVKKGLYRLDTDPARFQSYEGEAIVKSESGQLTLKGGKETALSGVLMAENFDKKAEDDLYRWSSHRSASLAKASLSSAMNMGRGFSSGSSAYGYGWQWNPMFGLYTFVPYNGILYSPFGYGFFSPYAAYNYYLYSYGGGGYGVGGGVQANRAPSFTPYSSSQLGYNVWSTGRSSSAGTGFGGASSGGSISAAPGVSAGAAAGGGRTGGGAAGGVSGGHGGGGRR